MPAFSVVVINYNGKQFLEQTLSHIQESEISPEKVVIVDDASTDNSVQMVSEQFPEYTLIQHTENRGPTAARNTGAKEARGKYIVFMDNDVLIELDTFEELITFMEKDESRGVCSPVLINSQGSREWWNMGYDFGTIRFFIAGIFHKLWGIFPFPFLGSLSRPFTMNLYNYKDPIKVDWVSEQCNIVREKAFREVDGFDERFFMFHEGPDLCRRIRNNGYTIWVDPRIHVSLLDGHTHNTKKRKQWMKESTHHYKKKHGASIY